MSNQTGYRGVRKSKDAWRAKPYFARVKVGDLEFYSARYSNATDSARAYDRLAFALHGENAVLNFPWEAGRD